MSQKVTVENLFAMQLQAKETAVRIDQILRGLSAERQALREAVATYSTKRIELVKQELRARGLTWCTDCFTVISEDQEAELLFIEGKEQYSGGYSNSEYGFRGFSNLHRVCARCRELANDKHGRTNGQESFYAFRVEKRGDGYYSRNFGNWIKLDDAKCKLAEMPDRLIERLAEEWNLPPKIEAQSRWPSSEVTLIIHERAALAKAG